MTQERKFAKNLIGPGKAALVRENVSVAVRESSCLSKPRLIDPIDYETVIVKNKTLLHNDPQRELLLFPHDDVNQTTIPRRWRTNYCSVPVSSIHEAHSLLVKESIKSYTSNWNVIHYKYSSYSGSYLQVPKVKKTDALPEQVFEVDAEIEGRDVEEANKQRNANITKQGWLAKFPDGSSESNMLFTRSAKRRYCYLKQQADATYILEFYKDEKKGEAKDSVFLDSATDVTKRGGKHRFVIHRQDKQNDIKTCTIFEADSENELESWVAILKKVIQPQDTPYMQRDRFNRGAESSPGRGADFRESLESSMNPELQKYARETESILAAKKKKVPTATLR